jgi:hypothetical protein
MCDKRKAPEAAAASRSKCGKYTDAGIEPDLATADYITVMAIPDDCLSDMETFLVIMPQGAISAAGIDSLSMHIESNADDDDDDDDDAMPRLLAQWIAKQDRNAKRAEITARNAPLAAMLSTTRIVKDVYMRIPLTARHCVIRYTYY